MIFKSFNASGTSRRAVQALLLSAILSISCAAPSHAWPGFGRPTIDSPVRTVTEGGFLRFLHRIFGFAGGTMDPNGQK